MPRCSIWKASSTSDPYLALPEEINRGTPTVVGRQMAHKIRHTDADNPRSTHR